MINGTVSRMSEDALALATTISPKTDLVRINDTTSTTVLATILPPYDNGTFSGILVIANRSGANITTVTTGNILTAVTIGVNVAVVFIYSKGEGAWIPGALA